METVSYSPIYAEDLGLGYGTRQVRLMDGSVVNLSELDISFLLPLFARAHLPSNARTGALARLSDDDRGLWLKHAYGWSSLTHRYLDVMRFGAVGDGDVRLSSRFGTLAEAQAVYPHATSLNDTIDWAAIQAAVNVADQGDHIIFPAPPSFYALNRSVQIGAFTFSNPEENVTGFTIKTNLVFEGGGGTDFSGNNISIKWVGDEQNGTTAVTKGTGGNTYTYYTDEQPMFHFVGGRFFTLKNLDFDGDLKAWTAVHTEGNNIGFFAENCTFRSCKVGFRDGTRWSHGVATQYFGRASDPSYAAGQAAVGFGGWQQDTHQFLNCFFFGNEIVNYSSESAQIVFAKFQHSNFAGAGDTIYQIFNMGGRLIFDACYFTGTMAAGPTTYTVYQATGSSTFSFKNCHQEATNCDILLRTAALAISEQIDIDNCTFPTVDITLDSGGAYLSVRNSQIGTILRTDRDADLFLEIKNSEVEAVQIAATTAKNNIFVDIANVKVTGGGALFTGAGKDDIIGTVRGISPQTALDVFTGASPLIEVVSHGEGNGKIAWTRNGAWSDGRVIHFSGIKDAMPDNVATAFVAFFTPAELSGMVSVHVMLSTGTGANRFATSDIVTFSFCRDVGGNVTLSSVVVTGASAALDGFGSAARTYTVAYNAGAGRVELSLNQNNDNDATASVCYEGVMMQALAPGSFQNRPDLVLGL